MLQLRRITCPHTLKEPLLYHRLRRQAACYDARETERSHISLAQEARASRDPSQSIHLGFLVRGRSMPPKRFPDLKRSTATETGHQTVARKDHRCGSRMPPPHPPM